MKIASFLSFLFLLAIVSTPISAVGQSSPKTFKVSINDPGSGNKLTGTVQSVVINHEEQDAVYAELDATKEWSFTSPLANQSLNEFLTEEEYLNVVRITLDGKTAILNNARRMKIKKTSNGYRVAIKFKSIKY